MVGRSNFLDSGLRFYKFEPHTGKVLTTKVIDSKDPTDGSELQDGLRTLQMSVGLSDILSSDGESVYMRSQRFDFEGNRIGIGPHSGDAPTQGSVQSGDGRHLFSPTGFLDGDWFHRSYWVFGKSFAGGHNGYYQAGKFTPSDEFSYAMVKMFMGSVASLSTTSGPPPLSTNYFLRRRNSHLELTSRHSPKTPVRRKQNTAQGELSSYSKSDGKTTSRRSMGEG